MIRTRYHGEASYKLIVGINHNVQLRIQLCLILKYLGLPRDLRQLLIRRVWFDCQSEVIRQEKLIWFPIRPKFVVPINGTVAICNTENMRYRVGRTYSGLKWERLFACDFDSILKNLDDKNNFPSILKMRKRKKLKTQ